MKILAIAGSLRAKSNTLHYVEKGLTVLQGRGFDTELISLRGKAISPCNGCYDCVKKGYCTIEDDDFAGILAKMNLAFSQLLLWFFINGVTVPGSTYWNVGMAGTGGARDAENDEEGLATVVNFAHNMADVMQKIFG